MYGSMKNDLSHDYAQDQTQDTNQRPYTSMRHSQANLDRSENPLVSAKGEVLRVNSWANHGGHSSNSSANNLKKILNDMSDQDDDNNNRTSAFDYGTSPKPSMFKRRKTPVVGKQNNRLQTNQNRYRSDPAGNLSETTIDRIGYENVESANSKTRSNGNQSEV